TPWHDHGEFEQWNLSAMDNPITLDSLHRVSGCIYWANIPVDEAVTYDEATWTATLDITRQLTAGAATRVDISGVQGVAEATPLATQSILFYQFHNVSRRGTRWDANGQISNVTQYLLDSEGREAVAETMTAGPDGIWFTGDEVAASRTATERRADAISIISCIKSILQKEKKVCVHGLRAGIGRKVALFRDEILMRRSLDEKKGLSVV
ncbi:MAG: hypothetical protein ACC628_25710, partial [Pirellulaceae bacterium]